jgi:hypothetical protein
MIMQYFMATVRTKIKEIKKIKGAKLITKKLKQPINLPVIMPLK